MAVDLIALRDLVRMDIGSPGVKEIPNDFITKMINFGGREILSATSGEHMQLLFFTSVAQQQNYSAAAGITKILEVFWSGNQAFNSWYFDHDVPVPVAEEFGQINYAHRSIDLIREMQTKQILDLSSLGYSWRILAGQVWLSPGPSTSGFKIYYLGVSETGDVGSSLDSVDEELLMLYASFRCLQALAAVRSNVGTIDREGMEAKQNVALLLEMAKAKKAEFDERLTESQFGNV